MTDKDKDIMLVVDRKRIECHHGYPWIYTVVAKSVGDYADYGNNIYYGMKEVRTITVCSNCSLPIIYAPLEEFVANMLNIDGAWYRISDRSEDSADVCRAFNLESVSATELPNFALVKPTLTCQHQSETIFQDLNKILVKDVVKIVFKYFDICCSDEHAFLDCAFLLIGPENDSGYHTIQIVPSDPNRRMNFSKLLTHQQFKQLT